MRREYEEEEEELMEEVEEEEETEDNDNDLKALFDSRPDDVELVEQYVASRGMQAERAKRARPFEHPVGATTRGEVIATSGGNDYSMRSLRLRTSRFLSLIFDFGGLF